MPPKLRIYDEEGKREVDLIYDKVSFGRDAKCTVQIRDTMSSREHCVIERSGGTDWMLRDCESRNGTRVNGSPVSEHKLNHGDEVQIGDVVIRFENPGGATGGPAARPQSGQGKRASSPSNKRPSKMTSAARRPRAPRSGGDAAVIGGIIGVAALLLIVALVLSQGSGGPSDDRLLDQAAQHIRMEEWDSAESKLRRAKNSKRKERLENDLMKARNAKAQQDMAREADRAWNKLQLKLAKKELKGARAVSELRRFIRDFPDMLVTRDAEKVMKDLEKKLAAATTGGDFRGDQAGDNGPPRSNSGDTGGGGPGGHGGGPGGGPGGADPGPGGDSGEETGSIDDQVKKLLEGREYDEAIRRLRKHFDKTADTSVTKKIEEIEAEADRKWESIKAQAKIAVAAKRIDRARELLMGVKMRWGGRWSDAADDELGKLPAQ